MPCPICNRTIASGDFCDDLQCPNPTRDAAEGAGRQSASLLRGWAKAYRDTPEHRFPSDPNAEFFPVDLECAADLLSAPPKPAPDPMREALIADILKRVSRSTGYNGDYIERGLREKLSKEICAALSAPVPPADGAGEQLRAIQETVSAVARAVENLACHQEQADHDGVMVKVSRQAVDEVVAAVGTINTIAFLPPGTGAAEPVALANALEKSDWSNTSIENKALIQNAIITLRATPPVRGDREANELLEMRAARQVGVPLADHDEIGRMVLTQPWEIQKIIVTITAHCTVLVDGPPASEVAALAGCISQECLALAKALSLPVQPSEREAKAEYEGYIKGLIRAGNMKSRIPRDDNGSMVLNDIRAQIDAEIVLSCQAPPSSDEERGK